MKTARMQVGERQSFVKNLLLVDGISRSGKFLMADLLAGFYDIEAVQYFGLLEHIPFLEKFKLIDHKTAVELLKCEIDTHAYEMAIGRNFNHRQSDKSSIYKNPSVKKFLQRSEQVDIQRLLSQYNKKNPYSFFVMHELIPNAKIYFQTFPHLKMICLQRSPIELVDSWYRRGLAKRLGNDPALFVIPFKKGSAKIPWYMVGQEKEYISLTDMDRTIFSIERIVGLYNKGLRSLTKKERSKILFVRYEDIMVNTQAVLKKLSMFLGKKSQPGMSAVLRRECLPNHNYLEKREAKLQVIGNFASPKYLKRLKNLEILYQSSKLI